MDFLIADTFTDTRARDHLLVTSVDPASEFLDDLLVHQQFE
jgi:hypothetical protein